MADHGYAGTSISAICKESGLPASSVYWHFENKEGLLHAVMERGTARMIDEISAAYDAPGTPRERLHLLLSRAAAVFQAQPREFRRLELIITLERGQSGDAWQNTIDQFHERMRTLIENALFEIYRSKSPKEARAVAKEGARLAQTMGSGATYESIRNPDEFNPEELIDHLEHALLGLGERRLAKRASESAGS